MNKPNKNIGLLGSSFNPPHLGHLSVLTQLTQQQEFDEIWMIPVYYHAFSKNLAPFETRLTLASLLCEEIESKNVKVLPIERELQKKPSYTIDVVLALKNKYPDFSFSLILGTDTKNDLPKWHKIDELRKLVGFYFIPRKGYEDSPHPEVSSTDIRERLEKGLPIDHLTTKKIANYLIKNRVY